jgi:hypothetical protein
LWGTTTIQKHIQQYSLLITEGNISAKEKENQSLRWGRNQHIFLRSSNAKLKSGKVLARESTQTPLGSLTQVGSTVEVTLLGKLSRGKNEILWGITTKQKDLKPSHFLALLEEQSLPRRRETQLRWG